MKFTTALGLVFLATGLVHAEKIDECEKFKRTVQSYFQPSTISCVSNEEGKMEKLSLSEFSADVEALKLSSYDALKDITLTVSEYLPIREEGTKYDGSIDTFNYDYQEVLKDVKNLEKLSIIYDVYENNRYRGRVQHLDEIIPEALKDLKNLKELNVSGIKISQENINDISTLENLESLSLDYCSFEDVKDFSALNNLKNVSSFSAMFSEYNTVFADGTPYNVPVELVNAFGNVKTLKVENCRDIIYTNFKEVEELVVQFPELGDLTESEQIAYERSQYNTMLNMKVLKNIKDLTYILHEDSLSAFELESFDSLESLTIYYEPDHLGYASFPYQNIHIELPKNIKNIYLHGVNIDNDDFNEILKLDQLESIRFDKCKFEDGIVVVKVLSNLCPIDIQFYECESEVKQKLEDFVNDQCEASAPTEKIEEEVKPEEEKVDETLEEDQQSDDETLERRYERFLY